MRSILLSGFVALRYKGAFQQDRTASAFLCQKLLTGTSSVKAGFSYTISILSFSMHRRPDNRCMEFSSRPVSRTKTNNEDRKNSYDVRWVLAHEEHIRSCFSLGRSHFCGHVVHRNLFDLYS